MTINEQLAELYNQYWDKIKDLQNKYSELSPAILMKLKEDYAKQEIKLFVIGQQTKGWDRGESVGEQMAEYEEFKFGRNYRYNNSPFWRAVRKLENELGISEGCIAWSNLNKMDFNDGRPKEEISNEMAENLPLLRQEIKICQPGLIIFFTGPCHNYDSLIEYNLGQYNKYKIDPLTERELIQLKIPEIDAKVYRTYHPNCLSYWKMLDKIVETIVNDFQVKT